MADSKKVLEIIKAIGAKMEEKKEYLTELDQPIGDSDHGINMARGFGAVEGKLPGLEGKDIGTILKTVGMTLVSTVGGASGPLYGSAYMKAGMAMAGKEEMDMDDFLSMMKTAVEAVEQRGKATVEEATMLDAMVPSLKAMEEAAAEGKTTKKCWMQGFRPHGPGPGIPRTWWLPKGVPAMWASVAWAIRIREQLPIPICWRLWPDLCDRNHKTHKTAGACLEYHRKMERSKDKVW